MATVVQLTDLHLFQTRAGTLHGVSTWPRFERALAMVQRRWPDAERLLITGDIAHDELPPTYTLFHDALGEWVDRTVVIPGNHDHRSAMQGLFPQQPRGTETPWIGFEEQVGAWLLIGLDTHQPGLEAGGLSAEQLAWCTERLARHAPKPALLFMHHPPVPVGSEWLDVIALHRPAGFVALVKGAPNLRGIFCGHVHQHFEAHLHGVPVRTTPSTAYQFVPGLPHFALDDRPCGLRVFELEGEDWTTEVVRLERETGAL